MEVLDEILKCWNLQHGAAKLWHRYGEEDDTGEGVERRREAPDQQYTENTKQEHVACLCA